MLLWKSWEAAYVNTWINHDCPRVPRILSHHLGVGDQRIARRNSFPWYYAPGLLRRPPVEAIHDMSTGQRVPHAGQQIPSRVLMNDAEFGGSQKGRIPRRSRRIPCAAVPTDACPLDAGVSQSRCKFTRPQKADFNLILRRTGGDCHTFNDSKNCGA